MLREIAIVAINQHKMKTQTELNDLTKILPRAKTERQKNFFQHAIYVMKLRLILIDSILKNNHILFDTLIERMKDKSTEMIGFLEDDCKDSLLTEEKYRKFCKDILVQMNLLQQLANIAKTLEF